MTTKQNLLAAGRQPSDWVWAADLDGVYQCQIGALVECEIAFMTEDSAKLYYRVNIAPLLLRPALY
jgi:hypothetical protein